MSARFFFHLTPPPQIYTLSLHDALPICFDLDSGAGHDRQPRAGVRRAGNGRGPLAGGGGSTPTKVQARSEEHTSELQSRGHLVCRLLLEKKKYHSSPR